MEQAGRVDFYLKPGITEAKPEAEEFLSTIAETFSQIIRDEDYVMGASQQTAANTRSLEHIISGRNEPALHHYHNTYRAKLGLDPLPTSTPTWSPPPPTEHLLAPIRTVRPRLAPTPTRVVAGLPSVAESWDLRPFRPHQTGRTLMVAPTLREGRMSGGRHE